MEKLVGFVAVTLLGCALMCATPILYTLAGCFGAWIVGMVWPHTMAAWLAYFHCPLVAWQVGGLMAFVGSYFRSSMTTGSGS